MGEGLLCLWKCAKSLRDSLQVHIRDLYLRDIPTVDDWANPMVVACVQTAQSWYLSYDFGMVVPRIRTRFPDIGQFKVIKMHNLHHIDFLRNFDARQFPDLRFIH